MNDKAETILVVEDDSEVRGAITEMLRKMGYKVLEASSGPDALEVSKQHSGEIKLLLTDLIMPGMTGRLLADTLLASRPAIKVIFMSGYVDGSRHEALEPAVHYLPKPVNWKTLQNKISGVLETGEPQG